MEFPVGKVLYESAGYLSDLRVSPNGDEVAFMEHPAKFDDRGSVNVVNLQGKMRVLSSGYWGMEGLAWSANGSSVLFSATLNGSDYVVHEVGINGRERFARMNVGLVTIYDIAPDGTWAVTQNELPIKLAFRAAGSTQDVDLSWLDNALNPILSADAKTLVFTDQSISGGPNYSVCVRSTSGGSITRLGEGLASALSADGRSILACVFSTPPRLMRYPVGAGQAQRLDHGDLENITYAKWMADGNHVLVSGNTSGKPPRCFVLDPATGTLTPVGPDGIWEGVPAPDGKRFIARTQTGYMLCASSGTGDGTPVPSMTPADYMIRWSPDGQAVYTFQRSVLPTPVDKIDIATGKRETVMKLGDATTAGLLNILTVSMADDLRSVAYANWLFRSVLYTVGRPAGEAK